jgi:hypothetical protein
MTGVGRKCLAPVLALFLTLPHGHALILDQRSYPDGSSAGSSGSAKPGAKRQRDGVVISGSKLTVKAMQGDPGFLVNGQPVRVGSELWDS